MGMWLGIAAGMGQRQHEEALQEVAQNSMMARQLHEMYLKLAERPDMRPEGVQRAQQLAIQALTVDPRKPNASKQLEKLAQWDMTVEMPSGTQTPTPGAAQPATTPTPAMPAAPPFMAPTTEPQRKSAMYDQNELQMMDLSQKAQLAQLATTSAIERERALIPLKSEAKTAELKAEATFYTDLGKQLGLSGTALANFVINKSIPQASKFAPLIEEYMEALQMGLIPEGTTFEDYAKSKRSAGGSMEKELADLYEKQGMPRVEAVKKAMSMRAAYSFNLQNPAGTGDTVKWIADQAERNFAYFPALTGKLGKNVQKQVLGELQNRGVDVHKLTTTNQAMAEIAHSLIGKFDRAMVKLEDPRIAAKFGPAMGRFQEFMAGKVGAADPDFAELRSTLSLLLTGTMRAHFGARGGQQMYDHFVDLLNSGRMDAPTLLASMRGLRDFMKGYEEMEYGGDEVEPRELAPPPMGSGTKPPATTRKDPLGLFQ